MSLDNLAPIYLQAIEEELHQVIAEVDEGEFKGLYDILAYHLGWQGSGSTEKTGGKRIRPLLVLLTCEASDGQWRTALPAAAGVELIHNFSLIHDDIQDNSPIRRGRPTVWKRWGIAQAINAGDAMFTLAHLSLLRLGQFTTAAVTSEASLILNNACLSLTRGQHLDLCYEDQGEIALEAYWPMVEGKTAALLSACTELGAMITGVSEDRRTAFREFGTSLGLAFQVQDDLLGIWGDVGLTGKSAKSDLLSGKKSLPILYGLSQNDAFARRWTQPGTITPAEVPALAAQLEKEGAREYTKNTANRLTQQALAALQAAEPQGQAGKALVELADRLLRRNV